MPEDKRPKPALDMRADPQQQSTNRLPPPDSRANMRARSDAASRKGSAGMLSFVFAGLIGGFVVAGAVFLAFTQQLPGISLADPEIKREVRVLQDRTAILDKAITSQARNTQAAPASGGGAVDAQALNELRARLDSIVQGTRSLDQTVQGLSERITGAEKRIDVGLSPAAVEAEVTRQVAPITGRLATVEQILDGLNKAQSERQAEARSAALTLALTNLKRAVGDGRPFVAELAAVENISTTKLPVAQLAVYRESGVPTLSALQREFGPASKRAIEKHYRGNNNNIVGEVLSRAKSAIQIKSADNSGVSIEAVLGRIEAALNTDNPKAAIAEGEALKGPAAEEIKPWLARLQARVASEEALRKTDQELLAVLTRPVSRRQ